MASGVRGIISFRSVNPPVPPVTPVRVLHLNGCPVRDLTALQGMKLIELGCVPAGNKEIDLSPVADAPLDRI